MEVSAPIVPILGTPVTAFCSCSHAVEVLKQRIDARQKTFCAAINPEKLYRARRDAALRRTLALAHIRLCDGVGVSLASLLLHGRRLNRTTGIELFFALARRAAHEGWKVFLLGASAESSERACRKLTAMCPGLAIAGRRDGFFASSEEVVTEINESGADVLFVAMGSPRQEFWIREHLEVLRPTVIMGVGGSLDVLSGTSRWAPAAFRKLGLEWLFRLVTQPSRLRRQLVLPLYAMDIFKASLGL